MCKSFQRIFGHAYERKIEDGIMEGVGLKRRRARVVRATQLWCRE